MFSLNQIRYFLSASDKEATESLARQASRITRQYFGRTVSLYAPLYLSNYCSSNCIYCGFNSKRRFKRFKLNKEEMRQEMSYLSSVGIESILLLTGESYKITDLNYIKLAVSSAKKFFPSISLEVHPMETSDYEDLAQNGVDGITVYQETYDKSRYQELHMSGKKADYGYRRQTPERAAKAGIRHISMGILLGLSDPAYDLWELFQHLRYMEKTYPGVEYSLSFPRLQTIQGENYIAAEIKDETLIKILCMARITFPRVGLNLSTRESPSLRDHAVEIGVTRLSAGSKTSVGGYTLSGYNNKEPQFDIKDRRSVAEIINMLKQRHIDPILTEWRHI